VGTSAPHPGSGPGTPLVPPWADPNNPAPSPPADPKRFRDFRNQIGRFAVTGGVDNLRSALKHFAGTASGGASTGGRRFTAMMGAGADAILALGSPEGIAGGLERAGVDLAALRGATLDTVIEAIARAFAPSNADHDKVEIALREALAVVLEDEPGFDVETFQGFDNDTYVTLVALFIENCVFQHILSEAGSSWDRAGDGIQQQARENQLRETIQAEVGQHLQPLADRDITSMTRDQLTAVQVAVVAGVLSSWEGYDD
jgi:predicted Fe-Mo cluster-binding NifX family protein